MTNEEIEQKACDLSNLLRANFDGGYDGYCKNVELISSAIREAKLQAYDEAIEAQRCRFCAQDKTPLSDGLGGYYHPEAQPKHPVAVEMPCEVSSIRALKDLLVANMALAE